MRAEIQRVLELQPSYTWQNSPAMKERGRLIRDEMPAWLTRHAVELARDIGISPGDFFPEGRDGTGRKTLVPWVRFGSRERTPSATNGFYIVYLFDADGEAVYLSLNQGTTDFDGREFVPKPPHVLRARVSAVRGILADWVSDQTHLDSMELRATRLGDGYERGSIAALRYLRGEVPDESRLLADARQYAAALGRLYDAQAAQPLPGDAPELMLAMETAEEAAGKPPTPHRGGFRVNAAEIKLVERRAVDLARAYYEHDGWTVTEFGKPFDLLARRGDEHLHVEVKGTVSDGTAVVLTEGEVEHHALQYPNNAFVIVRDIELDRNTNPPRCSGGTLFERRGWSIASTDLAPISYRYIVPPDLYTLQRAASSARPVGEDGRSEGGTGSIRSNVP